MRAPVCHATLALLIAAGTCHAQAVPRALVADVGALAVLPGQGGAVLSSFTQAQLRLSQSGTRWAYTINATGQPATNDCFILVGSEEGIEHVVAETVALPGIGVGFSGRPNAQLGVNDLGDLAFRATTTGPVSSNDAIIRYVAATGQYNFVALEGQPVPNVPGEVYAPFLDSVTLFNSGSVAFRAGSTTGPLPSNFSDFILVSGNPQTTAVQSGALVPTNQLGGGTAAVIDFFDEAYVAADQQSYIIEGALASPAANARVVVVNGQVVLQAGVPVPGLSEPPISGFVDEIRMFAGGDWALWGATVNGISYLVVNGSLRAAEGDIVPGGLPGEVLVTISDATMNAVGDLAYSASTSAARTIIVVDGAKRDPFIAVTTAPSGSPFSAGTQVDLTGDGVPDDAYCGFFGDDSLGLSSSGALFFQMRTFSAITSLRAGDALFVVSVDLAGTDCYANCDASTTPPVLNALDFACFLSRYVAGEAFANCDGSTLPPVLNALDFACFLQRYRQGCP